MKIDRLASGVAVCALTLAFAQSASALTININAGAGLAGNAAALAAFQRAADAWEAIFTDPVTVEIDADLQNTGSSSVIGSTQSFLGVINYSTMRNAMIADASDEASNTIVSSIPTAGSFQAAVPTGFTVTNQIVATRANLKALGFSIGPGADANITFNSNFAFDFDNSNGVNAGTKDFETVAAHEIGHALGFVSIVDFIDENINSPQSIAPTTLDLFRFNDANDPITATGFNATIRELRPGQASVFSDTNNAYKMSTGDFNGDGRQAAHWKDDSGIGGTGTLLGLFDPTLPNGTVVGISQADIRALDLIGWDVAVATVAAPASLSMFGLALGALGLATRRKRPAN